LLRQVRYYQITLIVAAVLLVIWQGSIVNSKGGANNSEATSELSFTTNTGATVTLPNADDKYTILIFWKAGSERCLQLITDAESLYQQSEFDTIATLYLINYFDSLPVAQSAVDFDNPDLPFAYAPEGRFLDRNPINSLPCTAILKPDGSVLEIIEGYQENQMKKIALRLEMIKRMTGKQGDFQFQFGGGDRK
jgi:hypothetical protein